MIPKEQYFETISIFILSSHGIVQCLMKAKTFKDKVEEKKPTPPPPPNIPLPCCFCFLFGRKDALLIFHFDENSKACREYSVCTMPLQDL